MDPGTGSGPYSILNISLVSGCLLFVEPRATAAALAEQICFPCFWGAGVGLPFCTSAIPSSGGLLRS